jgi:Holliday junction resolvase
MKKPPSRQGTPVLIYLSDDELKRLKEFQKNFKSQTSIPIKNGPAVKLLTNRALKFINITDL